MQLSKDKMKARATSIKRIQYRDPADIIADRIFVGIQIHVLLEMCEMIKDGRMLKMMEEIKKNSKKKKG